MPTISDVFTISDGDQQRPAIRTVSQQDPLMVAVSIYCPQGTRGDRDYPLFDAEVVFFGRDAETVLDNFQPGDPIKVDGELVVEINDDGYLNCDIEDASFGFVPEPRRQGQQPQRQPQQSGPQNGAQGPQNRDQQGPPTSPSADQNNGSRPPASSPGGSSGAQRPQPRQRPGGGGGSR